MKKYEVPKEFYSALSPNHIMTNPIEVSVRGKGMEYNQLKDHVVFFRIDASEKDEFKAQCELMKKSKAFPDIAGSEIFQQLKKMEEIIEVGDKHIVNSSLKQQMELWRINILKKLLGKVQDFSALFTIYSEQRAQQGEPSSVHRFFGAIPKTEKLEGVKIVKEALESTKIALEQLYPFAIAPVNTQSLEAFVKTLNQILGGLEQALLDVQQTPALTEGRLSKIFKNFERAFEMNFPQSNSSHRI